MSTTPYYSIIAIIVLVVALAYWVRVASTSKHNKKRITDILVIGIAMLIASKISQFTNIEPLKLAGAIILVYGWAILIFEKYIEGLNE
ncbi:hypothetical protein [Desulfitibacter alkalitolerans]|uniref:hypothetical protein n=1 Tax=Desulfitibacter alkalitolerans TaxID=264641 RepID=UPI00048202CF|nr:hypothetical protein [Desulfitibacter alkalitolerans]